MLCCQERQIGSQCDPLVTHSTSDGTHTSVFAVTASAAYVVDLQKISGCRLLRAGWGAAAATAVVINLDGRSRA